MAGVGSLGSQLRTNAYPILGGIGSGCIVYAVARRVFSESSRALPLAMGMVAGCLVGYLASQNTQHSSLPKEEYSDEALKSCIANGDKELLEYWNQQEVLNYNLVLNNGDSLADYAVSLGQFELEKFLVEKGVAYIQKNDALLDLKLFLYGAVINAVNNMSNDLSMGNYPHTRKLTWDQLFKIIEHYKFSIDELCNDNSWPILFGVCRAMPLNSHHDHNKQILFILGIIEKLVGLGGHLDVEQDGSSPRALLQQLLKTKYANNREIVEKTQAILNLQTIK